MSGVPSGGSAQAHTAGQMRPHIGAAGVYCPQPGMSVSGVAKTDPAEYQRAGTGLRARIF